MYQKELQSIKKANLFRKRNLYDDSLLDLASNDYLGLAQNKELFKNAYERVLKLKYHSPKASSLVNGYSIIHQEFEENLKKANNFEAAIVVGSGFLANLSLIETLVRKGDIIFIDEFYHASGILASRLLQEKQVIIFKHNDEKDLEEKIILHKTNKRILIAIEGVYSMHGDIAKIDFFTLSDKYNAILIVDEAHSSGVLGDNLLGLFDYYNIIPKANHIKMGTLGKAYGSYGAYILASKEIIEFLENRAKAIIYTTAPSLFDISLANEGLNYILSNKTTIKNKIKNNLAVIECELNIISKSLIIAYEISCNKKVLQIQQNLKEEGFLLGAIRQPTVKSAIIRLIAKIDISEKDLRKACKLLKELK